MHFVLSSLPLNVRRISTCPFLAKNMYLRWPTMQVNIKLSFLAKYFRFINFFLTLEKRNLIYIMHLVYLLYSYVTHHVLSLMMKQQNYGLHVFMYCSKHQLIKYLRFLNLSVLEHNVIVLMHKVYGLYSYVIRSQFVHPAWP